MKYGDISSEWSEVKWICTDCFETLLHRICSPEEVLDHCFQILAQKILLSEITLKEVWKESRDILKRKLYLSQKEEASYDELLSEFYARTMTICPVQSHSFIKFSKMFSDAMHAAENHVIVVNDELVDWLLEEKKAGKKIVCISDFYMSGEWIQKLLQLRNLGHLFDRVIVSSDIGLRKSTGHLYQFALEELNCRFYNEMFMIGDNRLSDYQIPKNLGIHSQLLKSRVACKKVNIIKEQLQKIYNQNKKNKMPFCNYIFSIYLFCERLLENLEKEAISDVWFFSREGKILKHIFEEFLCLCQKDNIQCHYLYISRQAAFLPSLSDIETEDFYYLRSKAQNLCINNFCESLGIQPSQFSTLKKRYDFDKTEEDFFLSSMFQSFKNESDFIEVYDQERKNANENAVNYFRKQGLCTDLNKTYAIVDIGWKGSIQDCLSRIFNDKYEIHGFYYGLIGDVGVQGNNKKTGLVFADFPVKTRDFEIYSINYRMLERLLCADHGGCLKYESAEPVVKNFTDWEEELFRFVAPFQERLDKELNDIMNIFQAESEFGNSVVIKDAAIRAVHKLFCVDVDKERVNQMEYMNRRMDMNFAAFGSHQDGGMKRVLRQIIRRGNKIEMIQKIEFQLYKMKLGFLAWVLCGVACHAINRNERRGVYGKK